MASKFTPKPQQSEKKGETVYYPPQWREEEFEGKTLFKVIQPFTRKSGKHDEDWIFNAGPRKWSILWGPDADGDPIALNSFIFAYENSDGEAQGKMVQCMGLFVEHLNGWLVEQGHAPIVEGKVVVDPGVPAYVQAIKDENEHLKAQLEAAKDQAPTLDGLLEKARNTEDTLDIQQLDDFVKAYLAIREQRVGDNSDVYNDLDMGHYVVEADGTVKKAMRLGKLASR